LFAVRDFLFLKAAEAEVTDYDSPEYHELRMTLNYMIRYAHNASVIRIAVFELVSRVHCFREGIDHKVFFNRKRLAMYNLSDSRKIELRDKIIADASWALLKHLQRTSPLFWLWAGCYAFLHHSKGFAHSGLRIVHYSLKESRLNLNSDPALKPA